jgi:MFS family permease
MMNNKGKKVTLIIGCLCLGFSLVVFGNADYLEDKWVFFGVCFTCRLIIGFGSACINSSSSAIIAYNFPE